jgi:hypothetical protein
MNYGAAQKTVAKADTAVLSSATHSLEIDTLGFEYASIDVVFSPFTAAAATAATAATVIRLAHSDTTGTAAQSNISGFVGATAAGGDFQIGVGATATSTLSSASGYVHRFDVDLRGRRRYLTVYATPVSTVGVITVARLSKGEAGPTSASDKGASTQAGG